MKQMIATIWKYNCDRTYVESRHEESFEDFKKRVKNAYPGVEYHITFYEVKHIW